MYRLVWLYATAEEDLDEGIERKPEMPAFLDPLIGLYPQMMLFGKVTALIQRALHLKRKNRYCGRQLEKSRRAKPG